ncbi:hypothetical protein [Rhodoferax sp. WC2427]|uniref:hypothetical protein n=1 Tax=Rhodoferax sp. WC2427 TaxID=3234144 RepID=UPI00346706E7
MTPASLLAKGRLCGLFALLTLASLAKAAECGATDLSLLAGVQHSRWQEFDARGRKLVDESGLLHHTGLQLEGDCASLQWAAQWSQGRGTRDYDGVSSANQPIQTTSRLSLQRVQLQAWAPVAERWAVGARLGWTQWDRDLASVGPVQGYPEQFRTIQAAVGVRYILADVGGLRWTLSSWLGGGPGGTLYLQLPNTDAARLRLGHSQMAQLGVQLELPESVHRTGWSWRLGWQMQQEQMRAGPSHAITRNGILVGGAAQPKTRQTSMGLDGALRYRF